MSCYNVGLDLSYSGTGVVIIHDETVETYEFKAGKPNTPFHERAADLWKQLARVMPNPATNEVNIVIEGAAYAAEFNAFTLGELTGAVKVFLYLHGYKYELAAPNVVKKFATGSGNAQKTYVAACVAQKWGFVHKSNNVSDAYVLAKIAEIGITAAEQICQEMTKSKTKKGKVK